ncbi:DSD1 family PLP-dependent enzyme [Rhizobium sp. BK251]|uniref:DSD1 family PLP-dependent enzyme n=1 Tax=Rhizobium sp. BK251 TaxID=2512125 RepID=UPI00104B64FE|nr:DSD1 family PLP-dependent enzyme [Rhizobium sp. BK251]TCL71099.1 D-serine deaminase-like pyridoxal phosphate-dependent protein [Rhizobium sp. BK251]
MLQNPPAEAGMREDEVDTPALIVDLDALEENMDRMAAFCAENKVGLRAHAKTHKSPVVAHWQMARGAVGQCVQKVGEAEVLAWGGVPDILVSNEVVTPRKIARLAALSSIAKVSLCADDAAVVDMVESIAEQAGCRLTVLVEINVGAGRCGVEPGDEAVALARRIAASRHLVFGGLQAYHGRAQHLRRLEEREVAIAAVAAVTRMTVDALDRAGLACAIVGGGGTGTFPLEAASGAFNEIQAGSYIFMDADYGRNEPAPSFRQSLFVLTTVMSAARSGLAVVDCGHKGIAIDSGLPLVHGRPGISYAGPSDEHGMLILEASASPLKIGEPVRLVPGHCDPTVDRYDWYVGVRNGRVETVWPVAARGMMS